MCLLNRFLIVSNLYQKVRKTIKIIYLCVFCRLSGCQVTETGCSFLASSLISNAASLLKHLDLSYNHPGDLGTRQLTDIQEDPNMKLKTLL